MDPAVHIPLADLDPDLPLPGTTVGANVAAGAPPVPPMPVPVPASFPFLILRWSIVALAAGLRIYWLDGRPPHFDEGVNGWFTDQMQKIGYYRYDPSNYHGPLHFYVLFLFKCLFGRNMWALRLPTALVGILTVDWILRFDRFFDRRLCVCAALAMTFSPSCLYFQRDAIHEAWLVFFLVLGCWGIFGLWQEGARRHLWAIGMAVTGMILTKETYVIHLACLFLAGACLVLLEWLDPSRLPLLLRRAAVDPAIPREEQGLWTMGDPGPSAFSWLGSTAAPQCWRDSDVLVVLGVSLALIAFFYSGNFLHPDGLKGLITAFAPWGKKAQEGEGHNKAFYYWCKLLIRNEPWAVLGVVGCLRYAVPPLPRVPKAGRILAACLLVLGLGIFAFLQMHWTDALPIRWRAFLDTPPIPDIPSLQYHGIIAGITLLAMMAATACLSLPAPPDWRLRLLAIYAPGALAAYSIIPYKTPWCIISIVWPFFFVAAALLVETARRWGRTGLSVAVGTAAALTVVSGWFALELNFWRSTDEKEDYVYVQSFDDVWTITEPLLNLAHDNPSDYHIKGIILCGSAYPLPWLLGDFTRIGYYPDDRSPDDYQGDFLLVLDKRVPEVESRLKDVYYKQAVRIRPALSPLVLYLRASLFRPLMPASRAPEFHPSDQPLTFPALPVKVEDGDE